MELFLDNIDSFLTLLILLTSVFGFYFNTRSRLADQEKKISKIEDEIDSIKDDNNELKSSLAVIRESQKNMKEILDEIKGMLNGRVVRNS